jgi:ribonuclease P/MRP protein subunit POP1
MDVTPLTDGNITVIYIKYYKATGDRTISVVDYAQSRVSELKAMEKALANATEHNGIQREFQKLPRHMRRRAASHNVKRIPLKHRQKAIDQVFY